MIDRWICIECWAGYRTVDMEDGSGIHSTCSYCGTVATVRRVSPRKMPELKPTNPKDAIGSKKVGLSAVPAQVVMELGLALGCEGAPRYGRHNYRIAGVRASVYYDAAMRHLMAWWEGEDIDPDSGLPHVVKAMACMAVLRDAQINNKLSDDRPPLPRQGWVAELNKKAEEILARYPEPKRAFTKDDKGE